MKICIGSLSYDVTAGDLRAAFEAFGQIASANGIKVETDAAKGATSV